MATDIIGSLFGVNPAAYQQAQQNKAYQQDYQAVQLDPLQQANLALRQGGRGFGQLAGGLMGMEDPELAKASQIKQIASQADLSSPEGMIAFAQAIQPFAPAEAAQALKRADDMKTTAGTRELTARKIQTEGNKLEWVGVEGQPDMKQQAVVDVATGNIIRRVGDPISVVTSRSSTTVKLPEGESEFVKQLGKNDAGVVTEAMKTRSGAINTLQSLEKLAQLNDQQLISGTFAEGRVGAANLLNTLGLASKDDVSRISSSQQYNKLAKDVIFQTLGGKLGAGFSNEDRKFIEALIPQLETSAAARRQLISYMRDKNQLIADESTRLENYARTNRGLGGFEYKIPRETLAPAPVSNEKTALEAELKRRKLLPQ